MWVKLPAEAHAYVLEPCKKMAASNELSPFFGELMPGTRRVDCGSAFCGRALSLAGSGI